MADSTKLNLSIMVKARMLMSQELLRQRVLSADVFDHELLDGLVEQRGQFEQQQQKMIKSLVLMLLLAFVAWNGSTIIIPGTGATIDQIPAFFELSLAVAAFHLMLLPYVFLNGQLYDGIIHVIAGEKCERNLLDADISVASKVPTWLVIKYSNRDPIIGRENLYENSRLGVFFYCTLINSLAIVILLLFAGMQIAVLFLAHEGLNNDFFGWFVYVVCIACAVVFVLACAAIFLSFDHTIKFEHLLTEETAEQGSGAGKE